MVSTRPFRTTVGPFQFASATLIEDPGIYDCLDLEIFDGANLFVDEETKDGDLWWYSNESPDVPTGVRVMNAGFRLRQGPVHIELPNGEKAILEGVDPVNYRRIFGLDPASEFVPDLKWVEWFRRQR